MTPREVVIYTTMFCPYCDGVKSLLQKKGVPFQEIKIDGDREARRSMSERAGGRTSVPQVFIDGRHVGGCDDLYALEGGGKLDGLLGTTAS